jgi:hypothetical protein
MVADDKTTPGLSSCEFSKKVNEERERKRKRSQDEGALNTRASSDEGASKAEEGKNYEGCRWPEQGRCDADQLRSDGCDKRRYWIR